MSRSLEEIREFFSGDKFATKLTGIEIEKAEEGYSLCTLELNDDHKNLFGDVMGGVLFTLADFAFAVASNKPDRYTATLTSEIRYLTKAKGDRLIAECKVVRDGSKTCFADVVVSDNLDREVARVTVSGFHLN